MKKVLIVLVFFLFYQNIFSQKSNVALTGNVSASHNLGSKPLGISGSIDLYFRVNSKFFMINKLNVSSVNKIGVKDGYGIKESFFTRFYLTKGIFMGPGATVSYFKNSQWSKTALYPGFETGYNYKDELISSLTINFRDPLTQNHGYGGSIGLDTYIPLSKSKKWGIKQTSMFGILKFKQQPYTHRLTGYSYNLGLGVYYNF